MSSGDDCNWHLCSRTTVLCARISGCYRSSAAQDICRSQAPSPTTLPTVGDNMQSVDEGENGRNEEGNAEKPRTNDSGLAESTVRSDRESSAESAHSPALTPPLSLRHTVTSSQGEANAICTGCHRGDGERLTLIRASCSCLMHFECAMNFVESHLILSYSPVSQRMATCPIPPMHLGRDGIFYFLAPRPRAGGHRNAGTIFV